MQSNMSTAMKGSDSGHGSGHSSGRSSVLVSPIPEAPLTRPTLARYFEMAQSFDFGKGFSCQHFQISLVPMMENNKIREREKKKAYAVNFETATQAPNASTKVWNLWQLRIEENDQEYWFELEFTTWPFPIPILYRMVVVEESEGIRFQLGNLHVFDSKHLPVTWWTMDKTIMPPERLEYFWVHLFVLVPIAITDQLVKPTGPIQLPKFELDATFQVQADIFQTIVLKDDYTEDHIGEDSYLEAFVPDTILAAVNNGRRDRLFNCHRQILVLKSPYFHRELRKRRLSRASRSSESGDGVHGSSDGVIEIEGVDASSLESALRYIYTDCMPEFNLAKEDRQENECELNRIVMTAAAASKLELESLKIYCLSVLYFEGLDDQTRIKQFILADSCKLNELKVLCFEQLSIFSVCGGDLSEIPSVDTKMQIIGAGLQKMWNIVSTGKLAPLKVEAGEA